MNEKELMELVHLTKSDVYYDGKNRKAMDGAWLWLKWVVLPTALIGLAYLAYLGVISLKGEI